MLANLPQNFIICWLIARRFWPRFCSFPLHNLRKMRFSNSHSSACQCCYIVGNCCCPWLLLLSLSLSVPPLLVQTDMSINIFADWSHCQCVKCCSFTVAQNIWLMFVLQRRANFNCVVRYSTKSNYWIKLLITKSKMLINSCASETDR